LFIVAEAFMTERNFNEVIYQVALNRLYIFDYQGSCHFERSPNQCQNIIAHGTNIRDGIEKSRLYDIHKNKYVIGDWESGQVLKVEQNICPHPANLPLQFRHLTIAQ
jgi:hypothetical protein